MSTLLEGSEEEIFAALRAAFRAAAEQGNACSSPQCPTPAGAIRLRRTVSRPEAAGASVPLAESAADAARREAVVGIFDEQPGEYDAWYDTPKGRAVLAEELDAVRPLLKELPHPWLEVGVGTGRFAAALGVEVGIDPARRALRLAAERGVKVAAAYGEALPFASASFGAVLFALTLCFVANPLAVLGEARRVLRPAGGVIVGFVPAESPWGRRYRAQAAAGHPYYRDARFLTREELEALLAAAGLRPVRTRAALCSSPEAPPAPETAREGDDESAGFVALLAVPGS